MKRERIYSNETQREVFYGSYDYTLEESRERTWRNIRDRRRQYLVDNVYKHAGFYGSTEAVYDQCKRQLARLHPKTRWYRKNMKGYHLREVVVD